MSLVSGPKRVKKTFALWIMESLRTRLCAAFGGISVANCLSIKVAEWSPILASV
jgi:hypothetical protein